MSDDSEANASATRRRALMLGAAGATAVMSVRPALAQTAASVANCTIPIEPGARANSAIAADGSVVPAGTKDAVAATGRSFDRAEVTAALNGGRLPGTSTQENQAYLNYIRRLRSGQQGFTCFASLQMPRP